eukprot:TRINITY_DN5893_c1_g3_i1.p1 TRINITY_DN5893_c1_g3~~TRINITY_DN5893_c1_g3_i1.p1  ORF type:complete len:1022 (+),score=189.02 TRINITY_DN5893_c1_g3_i1:95-3160(+)
MMEVRGKLTATDKLRNFLETEATTLIATFENIENGAFDDGLCFTSNNLKSPRNSLSPARKGKVLFNESLRTKSNSIGDALRNLLATYNSRPKRKTVAVLPNMKVAFWNKLSTDTKFNNLIKGTISKGNKAEKIIGSYEPRQCAICLVPRTTVANGKKREIDALAYDEMIANATEEDQDTRRQAFADRQQQSRELYSMIDVLVNEYDTKSTNDELAELVNIVTQKLESSEPPLPSRHQIALDAIENAYSPLPVPGIVEYLVNGKKTTKAIEHSSSYLINVFEEVEELLPPNRQQKVPVSQPAVAGTEGGANRKVSLPVGAPTAPSPSPPFAVQQTVPSPRSVKKSEGGIPKGKFLGTFRPRRRFLRYQALCEAFTDLSRVNRIPNGLLKQVAVPQIRHSKTKCRVTYLSDWSGSLLANMADGQLYTIYTNSRIKAIVRQLFDYLLGMSEGEDAKACEATAMQFVLDIQSMAFPSYDLTDNLELAKEDYSRITGSRKNKVVKWEFFYQFMVEHGLMMHPRDLKVSPHSLVEFYSHLLQQFQTRSRDPDYYYQDLLDNEQRHTTTKQRTITMSHCDALDSPQNNKRDIEQGSKRSNNHVIDKGHIISSLATIFPRHYTDELQRIHEQQNQRTVAKAAAEGDEATSSQEVSSTTSSSADDIDELLEYLANASDGSSDSIRQAKEKIQSRVKSRNRKTLAPHHTFGIPQSCEMDSSASESASDQNPPSLASSFQDQEPSQLSKIRTDVRKKLEQHKVKEHPPPIVDNISFRRKYRPSTALGAGTRSLKRPTQVKALVNTSAEWRPTRNMRGRIADYPNSSQTRNLLQSAINDQHIHGYDDTALQLKESYQDIRGTSLLAASDEAARRKDAKKSTRTNRQRKKRRPQQDEGLPMFLAPGARRGYTVGTHVVMSPGRQCRGDAYDGDTNTDPSYPTRRCQPFSRLHSQGSRIRDRCILERVVVEKAASSISDTPPNPISCNSLLEVMSCHQNSVKSLPSSFSVIQQKYFCKYTTITAAIVVAVFTSGI